MVQKQGSLLDDVHLKALLEQIAQDPKDHEAYNDLGTYYAKTDPTKALRSFQRAIELKPDFAVAFYNLANVLKETGNHDTATSYYTKALEIDPQLYQAYFAKGCIYLERYEYAQAATLFKKALEINTTYPEALTNLGVCYYNQGYVSEAIRYYEKALDASPTYADAHFNLGLALLMLGNYQRGWAEYRWRWQTSHFKNTIRNKPEWNGEDISNKTLLIYAEQGYGDTLQFVRYINLVKPLCKSIILECPLALKTLIKNSFTDVLVTDATDHSDLCVPLMELPRIFKTTLTTIPAHIPYLWPTVASVSKAKAILDNIKGEDTKIGLLWQGSSVNKRGSYRSMTFEEVSPLLGLPYLRFLSLSNEPVSYRHPRLIDLSAYIDDFNDTAGFIAHLDLIITIDSAVAHLAGAMGKPVWLMLHFISDWRWMLNRDDSPWYPTIKIFRQERPNDWKGVISRVSEELASAYKTSVTLNNPSQDQNTRPLSHNAQGDYTEAIRLLKKVLEDRPNLAEAHFELALLLLKSKNFKEGWMEYEWRRELPICKGSYPTLPLPEWKGQDLSGKSILIYDEQGFGDAIQFVRFLKPLKKWGAKAVYLLCQKELTRLMRGLEGIDGVFARGVDFTVSIDYISPLLSLPFYMGLGYKDLHCPTPYLNVSLQDVNIWANKLSNSPTPLKVGLAWSGRSSHPKDKHRSIPFELLQALFEVKGVQFYSLQKDSTCSHPKLIDYTKLFNDFYDTAAFLLNLDLVVSVDTAVAHLAGALGKNTWLLLPDNADWRWFDDQYGTVWYDSVTLFRQPFPDDWVSLIEHIAHRLSTIQ